MPIQKTEAIVLRKRDFRETSLIVDFYTRDFGRLSGLLKGIRKEPAKFASSLENFSCNEIIFYPKRESSLHLVSACELREHFPRLRRDIARIGMASMMMELLYVLMPAEEKNDQIYELTKMALAELNTTPYPEKVLTIFKIKTLALSGFKPHFDSCVSCQDKLIGQSKFSLMLGGMLCSRCFAKDKAGRSLFRGTVASILHIEKNDFKNNLNLGLNPQIKRELESVLNAFLNFHLERELKSQRVLNRLSEPQYV